MHTDSRMRTPTTLARATAALLGLLLVSCSTTRLPPSGNEEELSRLVLVMRALPDGTVSQAWVRVDELDLSQYGTLSPSRGVARHIVRAMGRKRDCDEENRECMRECMSRPLPRGFGHITSGGRGLGGKEQYCNEKCMQPYLDCVELQDLKPQEFTAIDAAMDWLKRHRRSILVGSVVVVAGVAFVVVSAGAGIVILAPAVFLAASTPEPGVFIAEGAP